VALLVRKSGKQVIFAHERVGRNGKSFGCLKFRSMVPNAQQRLDELLASDPIAKQEWEREFKLRNDPRITPIGNFLRKTSLDELPQLWNVLKGEMSLVGPRPVIQEEIERYGVSAAYYFKAKPGLTGLWQVSGRNDVDYDSRIDLDVWYVQNWSMLKDLIILLRTVKVVLGRGGAY
jgi:undecaprenyl-phosphate galactose phosphotransferase